MKTTKRSKMLLSSIAMLLVALVALGSATFAWYAISRQVKGDDITVSASTPGGLEMAVYGASDWGTYQSGTQTWEDAATNLIPCKLTWSSTGYSAIQVSDSTSSSSALVGEDLKTATGTADQYVVVKRIKLRNTNSVLGYINCTITPSATTGDTYMALALVDASTGTQYAQVSSGNGTSANNKAAAEFTLTAGGAQEKEFYVIAYADGQNSNCTTAKAATTSIDFDVQFDMTDTTTVSP